MMNERDRPLAAVPAQARVEVRTIWSQLRSVQYPGFDSLTIENRLQKSRAEDFVAGRIRSVDAEVVGQDSLRLARDRGPVEGCGLRRQLRGAKEPGEAHYECDAIHEEAAL